MLLIYFKNADGKVCGWMHPSKKLALWEVEEESERFITCHGGGLKACGRLVRRWGGKGGEEYGNLEHRLNAHEINP